jgi:glycosyltransferase involved in cell wall biosynthesis
MSKPSLVLLQTQAEAAGAQEISRLLARELTRRGYDVRQLFLFRRTSAFDGDPQVSYVARQRPSNPFALARLLLDLRRDLARSRPDVVITFQHYGNLIGAAVARLSCSAATLANHNTAASTLPTWIKAVDRRFGAAGVYDRMIVNSHDAAKDFEGWPASYLRRLTLIEHGFADKSSALSKNEARLALARRLGVAAFDEAPLIGVVARLTDVKNVALLVELLAREPTWRAALVGQGPERAALEAKAAALGVVDRLHFVGEVAPDAVGDTLAALDLFVFPSQAETFGLAAVEAAQTGLPCLVNDLPVLRETLSLADGAPCAFFADANDVDAFAAAARRAMTDREARAALSAAGRGLSARYSLSAMVDGYEREIAAALAARDARRAR